jgi:hypothetical protein
MIQKPWDTLRLQKFAKLVGEGYKDLLDYLPTPSRTTKVLLLIEILHLESSKASNLFFASSVSLLGEWAIDLLYAVS